MEFILEFFVELILEGTMEVATAKSKKVPVALRIVLAAVLLLFYVGICGCLLVAGIHADSFFIIGVAVVIFVAFTTIFVVKVIQTKRKLSQKDS